MAGSSWPTLAAGRKASAADVNAHFAWLEGSIVPQSGGYATDATYDLGTVTTNWRVLYAYSINATSTAKGLAIGTTTVVSHSDVALEIAGSRAFMLPRLSSTQRDALTGRDGMIIFNTSTSQYEGYRTAVGAWAPIGGNLYRTEHTVTSFSNVANGGTATTAAINIASGGGRLNAIELIPANNGSNTPTIDIVVVLDGTQYASVSIATATATTSYLAMDTMGRVICLPVAYDTPTGTPVNVTLPYMGIDFATSCAVYVARGVGGLTAHVSVSKIV